MFSKIDYIKLPDFLLSSYRIFPHNDKDILRTEEQKKVFGSIAKFNIFIGPNNSGKSRFIRGLFSAKQLEAKSYFTTFSKTTESEILELREEYNRDIQEIFRKHKIENSIINLASLIMENREFFSATPKEQQKGIHLFFGDYLTKIIQDINAHKALQQNIKKNIVKDFVILQKYYKTIVSGETSIDLQCVEEEIRQGDNYPVLKIYIPALKGIRTFNESNQNEKANDIYQSRTFFDYFTDVFFKEAGWPNPNSIFTGLGLYNEITNHLLGELQKRELMREYEAFLSAYFFENQEVSLIPSVDSKVLNIKIGAEKEQPVYNLGDGLQTLIIITFPLFKYRQKHLLLFIEEPELFLHPGLQRMLFDAMNDKRFRKAQYFIATHSNHFLDFSLDIDEMSIFTCKKIISNVPNNTEYLPSFEIKNVSRSDKKTLELIGARNSSVFLSNCTIWVEGITDRLYLRHFLRLFYQSIDTNKEYREDIHYSFFEYSGSTITHFSFLKSENPINVDPLCGTIFLLADKDSNKEKRHERLIEMLGDRFYCLQCREIENLTPPKILKAILNEYGENELSGFDDYEAYKNEYLGKYIEDKLARNKKRKGKYASESGTIIDKLSFCQKAIKHYQSFTDLSDEAKSIIERIYSFIKKMNGE